MLMNRNKIIIKNAHTHNLKNLDIEIPKHKFVVFTGVSGSGKSSLLFDTVYTEAQRQLIETFSTFARARLPKLSRPDVDDIQNLSTTIVIDQKRMEIGRAHV
jgi:excinuclease UvrABC ATPase subunit